MVTYSLTYFVKVWYILFFAGSLLDDAYEEAVCKLKENVDGQLCTVSQDGWSNVHGEAIIASTIHARGKTHPLSSVEAGSATKDGSFCFKLCQEAIEKAEMEWGAKVIAFVCDNEPKMVSLRKMISEWRPHLIAIGCSAHYLNLVENSAAPSGVMSQITVVQRYFRDHHKEGALLKGLGGVIPQLPNITRWTSQRAALETFIKNHAHYTAIRDQLDGKGFDRHVASLVDNRSLLVKAKNLHRQLDSIAHAMNIMQDDSSTLVDAYKCWTALLNDENIMDATKQDIKRRFAQVIKFIVFFVLH